MTVNCDTLTVPGSDLRIAAYSVAPGSPDADKLGLLKVIGTQDLTDTTSDPGPAASAER